MSSPTIVNKIYYYEWGKKAPSKSRFKGIMNAAAIVGLVEYTNEKIEYVSEEDALSGELLEKQIEISKSRKQHPESNFKQVDKAVDSFWDYGTRGDMKNVSVISSEGIIYDSQQEHQLKQKIQNEFNAEGKKAWQFITSLPTHEVAEMYGLTSLMDYYLVAEKSFKQWFQKAGFNPDQVLWWGNVHVDTDNPHLHFVWTSKDSNKRKGFIDPKLRDDFKKIFDNEVQKHANFKLNIHRDQGLPELRQKDEQKKQLLQQAKGNIQDKNIEKYLSEIASRMSDKGRLQINSNQKEMQQLRPYVYRAVDEILAHPKVQNTYLDFLQTVRTFDQVRNERLHLSGNEFESNEVKRIRDQLANAVLKEVKENKSKYLDTYLQKDDQVLEVYENDFDKFHRNYKKGLLTASDQNPVLRLGNLADHMMNPEAIQIVYDGKLEKVRDQLLQARTEVRNLFSTDQSLSFMATTPEGIVFQIEKTNQDFVVTSAEEQKIMSQDQVLKFVEDTKFERVDYSQPQSILVHERNITQKTNGTVVIRLDDFLKTKLSISTNNIHKINQSNQVIVDLPEEVYRVNRGKYNFFIPRKSIQELSNNPAKSFVTISDQLWSIGESRDFVKLEMNLQRSSLLEGDDRNQVTLIREHHAKHIHDQRGRVNFLFQNNARKGSLSSAVAELKKAKRETEHNQKQFLNELDKQQMNQSSM